MSLNQRELVLQEAGCRTIHEDYGISGARAERPGLQAALQELRSGDVLTVWKLDRLGRSLPHLVQIIDDLRKAGIGFCSLQEQIDTMSAGGRFYLHILAALAEFERELISERTRAGMAAARRRGKHIGRPRKLSPEQLDQACVLLESGTESRASIAAMLGVDVTTLRRALKTRAA
ncbi:recombinase family protein [Marivibrio halodurans]|uniref:recombinase family protein n=1 Tax=Marivibrio halodurans TaxID=2039722 RepID=UPI0031BB1F4D